MDVAKYIGLFLLKNQSCYIHGLGNIELRRKPAIYDGKNLIPSTHEVVVVAASTVDDSLSNFIATNEQISISKASNALKEFTDSAKAALQSGNEVAIPSIGNFCEVNEKLQFNTSPYLMHSYSPIPAEKSVPRRADERRPIPQPAYQEQNSQSFTTSSPLHEAPAYSQPEEEREKKKGIIWWRVIMFVLILAALIGGIGFAVKNMLKPGGAMYSDSTAQKQEAPLVPAPDTVSNQVSPSTDTNTFIDTSTTMAVDPPAGVAQPELKAVPMESYKVVLNTYDERPRAEKRLRTLRAYGNKVELIAEDSSMYFIVMPITAPVSRRTRVLDSLKNNFNPDGVIIY